MTQRLCENFSVDVVKYRLTRKYKGVSLKLRDMKNILQQIPSSALLKNVLISDNFNSGAAGKPCFK